MRILAVLAVAAALSAQTRPTFEVASVKPAPGCSMSPNAGPSPGRLDFPCMGLRTLIRAAYGGFSGDKLNARPLEVVGGPSWLDSELFSVIAKAADNAPVSQMIGPMLQALLEERFQLKVHLEPRESPVYTLTVAKQGKLTPAKEGACEILDLNNLPKPGANPNLCGMPRMSGSPAGMKMDIVGTTMEEFAGRMLSNATGRPVVDKTGLTGRYDIHVEFSRDSMGPMRVNGVDQPAPPSDGAPSIFTAVQEQLGLKLTSDKASFNVIVVDSAAKPTQN
jgi:uncharacterized protein (TIGR03435 family)